MSESQEYYLVSIANIALPAGWNLLSASEDVAARNCPAGIPTLGEEGNFCNQYWDLVYQLDLAVCTLNGNHTFSFDVGCNPATPHCDLVDPAAPDEFINFMTVSDNFRGALTRSAAPRFTAAVRR